MDWSLEDEGEFRRGHVGPSAFAKVLSSVHGATAPTLALITGVAHADRSVVPVMAIALCASGAASLAWTWLMRVCGSAAEQLACDRELDNAHEYLHAIQGQLCPRREPPPQSKASTNAEGVRQTDQGTTTSPPAAAPPAKPDTPSSRTESFVRALEWLTLTAKLLACVASLVAIGSVVYSLCAGLTTGTVAAIAAAGCAAFECALFTVCCAVSWAARLHDRHAPRPTDDPEAEAALPSRA
jgi:hypothetical protein